ncbi:MAG: tetratricopeptide repeat protein, partial [Polaribacter sp.]|nr:tetratricopeptide repeat protein [Polaribacter sp.]
MKNWIFFIFLLLSQVNYSQNNVVLADSYYREGSYQKAIQIYKMLVKKSPYNTSYFKRLITCYQETSQFKLAENLLKERLSENPNRPYLNVELGYNYEKQHQQEIASSYYDKAINSIEKHPRFGGYIGGLFKQNNRLEYAITAYKRAMQYNPKTNYNFQIAQIYGEKGALKKMFQSYIDLVDTHKNYLKTVQQFTSKYISENPKNSNNLLFEKILTRKSVENPKAVWNQLLSWLFIQQKEYKKAFIQEKELFKRNPKYLSNSIKLGHIAFKNKTFQIAKQCFDFVIEHTFSLKEKLNATLFSLKIDIATAQPDVEKKFNAVFSIHGKNQTTLKLQMEYADYLTFQKNQPNKAKGILTEALSLSSSKFQKARLKLKLGDLAVFTGKFNKALIYFSQVQTRIKNHPLAQEAQFKVAQTSYFKNDFKWALTQLKGLKASTAQLNANDALDLFLIISDNQPKDSLPSGLALYAMADLLAYQHKNTQAIDSLQAVLIKFKGQPIEDEALYKQALLFAKTRQFEKAIVNYTKIIELDKEGILVDNSLYQLAELYKNQLNNTEKASEYYQK